MIKPTWSLLLVVALVAATEPTGCGQYDIEPDARAWASKMGYSVRGAACSTVDSDGDGYASCTLNIAERADPLQIECRRYSGAGCKVSQPKLNVHVP